eukprot:6180727-Pleurochrysis_carterae.AAC.1
MHALTRATPALQVYKVGREELLNIAKGFPGARGTRLYLGAELHKFALRGHELSRGAPCECTRLVGENRVTSSPRTTASKCSHNSLVS